MLFEKKKKTDSNFHSTPKQNISSIKVLGMGCSSCHRQYENAKAAVKNMELTTEVEYITDPKQIMTYGIMGMPAIVVNERVASKGKVLSSAEFEKLLGSLYF